MATSIKFEGWVGEDPSSATGKLVWKEFKPKAWEETDVDIQITHSAICGSDLHTLSNGWGTTKYPLVVGHEIVGKVVRVGRQAGDFKIGDVVGVGCQSDSCLSRQGACESCEKGEENFCPKKVSTYNNVHANGDWSQGGYALYNRTPGHFVVKIPPEIAPEHAAPMLCAGLTVYSPLQRYQVGPGKTVGVAGIGGLGHFAILFAKAMGSSVVAISRTSDKEQDAFGLGADDFISTSEDKDWALKRSRTLDVIINTASSSNMPLAQYLGLLKVGGTLVQLGVPDEPLNFHAFSLVKTRVQITGSYIGNSKEIHDMFELAAKKHIQPWVEIRPMKDANKAIVEMEQGLPRYRYVLKN